VDVPAEQCNKHGGGSGNLTGDQLSELREVALLLAAQVVEQGTQERILVCVTPRSAAREMLASSARAPGRFHGQLMAVYVTLKARAIRSLSAWKIRAQNPGDRLIKAAERIFPQTRAQSA
jgi:K+-sensing histidine kinase KdpD